MKYLKTLTIFAILFGLNTMIASATGPETTLSGFGTQTLTVTFSDNATATGLTGDASVWNTLTPSAIAADLTTEAKKQLFLDEFFIIEVSLGGVPTVISAAQLDAITGGMDWTKMVVGGTASTFTFTFNNGLFNLSYDLDKGNNGATRIDGEWIGSDKFENESVTFSNPTLNNPFKVEFAVPYSQATGPNYASTLTSTFITADTQVSRPFVLGIPYGTNDVENGTTVTITFMANQTATISRNGAAPSAFTSGTGITTGGCYEIIVTNEGNPNFLPNSQTTLRFCFEFVVSITTPMTYNNVCPNSPVQFNTGLCTLNVTIYNQHCYSYDPADYTFSYSPSFLIEQHETEPWLATLTRAIRSAEYYLVVTENATGRTGQALAHTVNVLPYNVIASPHGTIVNRFKAEEMPSESLNLYELALGVYDGTVEPPVPGYDGNIESGVYRIDDETEFNVDFAPRSGWEIPDGFAPTDYTPLPNSRLYGWIIILNTGGGSCEADVRRINVVVRGNEIIVNEEEGDG